MKNLSKRYTDKQRERSQCCTSAVILLFLFRHLFARRNLFVSQWHILFEAPGL
ncbi:hypothetical protein TELCIR_08940 [Teladorsagia circumcincta]|uniref:Uncharacterized protein n=1 Tax=Teladorsagia circumcincta TaxID=45464 RepID=A0A2G9UGG0_TELCI|nr:hypothetical protein TELCIR_08940 [Teladorsagia circumcincta]